MKRAIIGGFISLIGSIWTLAGVCFSHKFSFNGWSTPPGKLLTQITESNLTVWFGVSIAMVVLGIVLMAIEYFKKDN